MAADVEEIVEIVAEVCDTGEVERYDFRFGASAGARHTGSMWFAPFES